LLASFILKLLYLILIGHTSRRIICVMQTLAIKRVMSVARRLQRNQRGCNHADVTRARAFVLDPDDHGSGHAATTTALALAAAASDDGIAAGFSQAMSTRCAAVCRLLQASRTLRLPPLGELAAPSS
jgi:hypothetical protein